VPRIAALLVVLLVAPASAFAGKKEEAKAHITKATKAHKDGRFEEARVELEAAYALDPNPDLLYAIGQVPDDATELTNLATVAASTPFWVGLDDQDHNDVFTTQKGGATATFLPWVTTPPDRGPPAKDCVMVTSMTQISTDRCGNSHIAVCECEP